MEVDKDIKALTDQIDVELKKVADSNTALMEEVKKKAPIEKIEDLMAKNTEGEKKIKTLSDQLDAIQLSLKDKTLGQSVSHWNEMYKAYKEAKPNLRKQGSQFSFELKGSPQMFFKTLDEPVELSDAVADHEVIIPMRTPGVERLPFRRVLLQDIVQRGVTNSTRVTWVERSVLTDGAAPVLEDATYVLSNYTFIQNFAPVEKIGTFVKLTSEALEDWDQLLSEVRNELFPALEQQIENQIYQGTAGAPQIRGIIGVAGAYASATMNAQVINANYHDAVMAAANQLAENNYVANYCFMSPALYALMQTSKGVDGGAYLIPPFASQNGLFIGGVQLVPSNLAVAGSMLVGDFTKYTLFTRRNITVQLWDQDSTDPEFDRKTITASCRIAGKFPTVHQAATGAFCYDQAGDIITAIVV
jgi:HK97 family phage major capsid protein